MSSERNNHVRTPREPRLAGQSLQQRLDRIARRGARSTEPATGEVLATVGLASRDVAAAAAAARQAQPEWAAQPGRSGRADPPATRLLRTTAPSSRAGCPRGQRHTGQGQFRVELVLGELWEARAATQPRGHLLPVSEPPAEHRQARPARRGRRDQPVELPADPVDRAVAPALALGNASSSSRTRRPRLRRHPAARLFEVAGLPGSCCTCCPATPNRTALREPDVAMISFTGSTASAARRRAAGDAEARQPGTRRQQRAHRARRRRHRRSQLAGAWSAFLHQASLHDRRRHIVLESVPMSTWSSCQAAKPAVGNPHRAGRARPLINAQLPTSNRHRDLAPGQLRAAARTAAVLPPDARRRHATMPPSARDLRPRTVVV